ncbi:MAG TPA: hypothetical protein VMV74_12250 [Bacteroidales bacterium]|nr:hypothetical protein [Bacteroidales bacterium]
MRTRFIMCPREPLTRSSCRSRLVSFFHFFHFALFIIVPLQLTGQETIPILFHGVILDAGTQQPLGGAHYINMHKSAGAADDRGQVSFFARPHDTITFTSVGYKDFIMVISDTLFAREYTAGIFMSSDTLMIEAVIVVPRLGNLKAEIMADRTPVDQDMINAANNLKLSAYQGLAGANKLGDPSTNYELLRQKQRIEAYEKGGIPTDKMLGLSPLLIIPVIYVLAKGFPGDPQPPAPYISSRELQQIRALHDSLVYRKK